MIYCKLRFGATGTRPGTTPEACALLVNAVLSNSPQLLREAMRNPNVDINMVTTLIDDIPIFGIKKRTSMLSIAAFMGSVDATEILLSDPDINVNQAIDNDGVTSTALTEAVRGGQEDILKLLLSDARLDLKYKNQWRLAMQEAGRQMANDPAKFTRIASMIAAARKGVQPDKPAVVIQLPDVSGDATAIAKREAAAIEDEMPPIERSLWGGEAATQRRQAWVKQPKL